MDKLIYPKTAWLAITDICDNKCLWCYEQCTKPGIAKTMGVSLIEKILRLLKELGTKKIVLIGGEPLLHPQIFNIIKMIKEFGMIVSVVTNGKKMYN